jgi:competence protein ComEC
MAAVGDPPRGPRAALERLRRRVGSRLDPPGAADPSGALLRALVTGDRSRLTDGLRRPFVQSGTAHLLAVSGLHIGWAFLLGRLVGLAALYPWPSARLQRRRGTCAVLAGLVVASGYAALAGFSVPTLRAALMAAAAAAALLSGRRGAGWNGLSAAGLLILSLDPASLFEPSFGLSFLAVAGLLLWRPTGGVIGRLVGCTLGASLATAPLIAHLGLPLPALGIVANLLLVPWFTAVVVPLGLLTAALVLVAPSAAGLFSGALHAAAHVGYEAAGALGSPDLLPPLATPAWVSAPVLALFALRVRLRGEARRACVLAAAAAFSLLPLIGGPSQAVRGGAEMLFLNVGHGDATLVRSERAAWLVDAGPALGRLDAGRRTVLPVLRAEGVGRIDVLVLTHADRDHIGGAPSVLRRVPVEEIWIAAATADDADFARVRLAAARRGVPLRVVAAGHVRRVGSWRARVLWPPPGYRPNHRNAGSLVVRFEGPGGCALLPGDAPLEVERRLARSLTPCSVLKLGHHGSEGSSGARWLAALAPELAVASASRVRADRFPGVALRERLRERRVTLYETSRVGAVRVCFAEPFFVLPHRTDEGSRSSPVGAGKAGGLRGHPVYRGPSRW